MPKTAGSPISNQVTPLFVGGEDPADAGADDDVGAVDRVDGEVGTAGEGPLRVGSRQGAARLEQAEGPADVAAAGLAGGAEARTAQASADVLEEVGVVAAAAGPENW